MILVLSTIIVFGSIGSMVAYGSNSGGGSSNQRNNACYNAGFTDGRVHPYNQTTYNGVVLMVGLTTKDSCQVAYQGKGKIIFHAKR